jgi:ABC-type transport system involved in multi-copper enzyme maturation permease subunit
MHWSNSRESWQERIGVAALLAGAVILGAVRDRLTLSQEVLLWAFLLVALAVLLRRGWFRLIGPMLFYDLVRIARRSRYFWVRCLYVLLLSILLGWVYLLWYVSSNTGGLRPNQMANFAESFFYTFLFVQFLTVVVLTPAYTAGAIAEEKERKTLEFLLATDLRNREIVLSKLLSRLANLTLLVLAGLPILSFLQFLGGVDPNLVLAGFAATGLTMFSLAGLSILNSVLAKRPRDAIALTYLGVAAYLLLSAASWFLVLPPALAGATWTIPWLGPVTTKDFAHAVSVGNIVAVCVQLSMDVASGKNLANSLPAALGDYALFHGCVALLCTGWAVLRLRALAIKQSYGMAPKVRRRWGWRRHPAIGNRPMLWKELVIESGVRLNVLGRIFVLILVAVTFVFPFFIFDEVSRSYSWDTLYEGMNIWARVLGSIVACLLLLAVASRAASSISNERDRQTWDALLTTPLESNSILFAKWIGNVFSVRWGWVWLGAIYALALITGGLHPLGLVLLVGAWFVYAFIVSGIGLWYSMVSRTTLRATLCTLICTAGAGVGHWLLWMFCIPVFIAGGREPEIFDSIRKFQLGFTPPIALGWCFSFGWLNVRDYGRRTTESEEAVVYGLLGIVSWIVLGLFLAGINGHRFRRVTGRVPIPPRPAPNAKLQKPTEVSSPHGSSPSAVCDRQTS